MPLGLGAKGLFSLRGIDAGQPDLVLNPVVVQDGKRVAVSDANHAADQNVRQHVARQKNKGSDDQQTADSHAVMLPPKR